MITKWSHTAQLKWNSARDIGCMTPHQWKWDTRQKINICKISPHDVPHMMCPWCVSHSICLSLRRRVASFFRSESTPQDAAFDKRHLHQSQNTTSLYNGDAGQWIIRTVQRSCARAKKSWSWRRPHFKSAHQRGRRSYISRNQTIVRQTKPKTHPTPPGRRRESLTAPAQQRRA